MMEVNTSGYMPSISIELKGDKQAMEYLNKLAVKFKRRILIRVARKAARPLISRAKALAPRSGKKTYISAHRHISKGVQRTILVKHRSGELSRSIGPYLSKNRRLSTIYIGPRTKAVQRANNGWYGHFVELGTAGHRIKKTRKVVSPSGAAFTLKRGTYVPGQKAHPFMGPAWESTKTQVLADFERLLWDELKKV